MTVIQERLFGLPQTELTSDDYYTPAWVFERMGIEFDLDVCAPPGGIDWIPAKRYFTQEDDGLAQPWEGRVWMNPPFSGSQRWVDRWLDHYWGVCLLPHSRAHLHARVPRRYRCRVRRCHRQPRTRPRAPMTEHYLCERCDTGWNAKVLGARCWHCGRRGVAHNGGIIAHYDQANRLEIYGRRFN